MNCYRGYRADQEFDGTWRPSFSYACALLPFFPFPPPVPFCPALPFPVGATTLLTCRLCVCWS